MATQWTVYIIRCTDNSLYTGITTDIERRLAEHRSSGKSGLNIFVEKKLSG